MHTYDEKFAGINPKSVQKELKKASLNPTSYFNLQQIRFSSNIFGILEFLNTWY
jgi:hypothetical protein